MSDARAHGLTQPGYAIALAVAVLCAAGLACIYATEQTGQGWPVNTTKQVVFTAAAGAAGLLILRVGYQRIASFAYALFLLALLLLIPLALASLTGFEFGGLVPGKRGAHRWISLPGFQLQPSEFMKIAYVAALAEYLRYRQNYRTLWGVTLPVILSGVPLLLILMGPDLGTAILMIPVLLVMLFVAGARKRHLALFVGAGFVVAPMVWLSIAPYQRLRITGVLLQSETLRSQIIAHPERYEHLCSLRQALEWEVGAGMQLTRSKTALGSGGLTGEGWGEGIYVEYGFLPDRHNDFVFAMVGHQWGLVGCVVVLACYAVIVMAAAEIAALTTEPFGRLLAAGVMALIATQVLINVAMTVGLVPITGMTLPFVSYGGSSLLSSFIAAALLISVSQHRPFMLTKKPFEYTTPSETATRTRRAPQRRPSSSDARDPRPARR
jgi:rod shape determining protein RodA